MLRHYCFSHKNHSSDAYLSSFNTCWQAFYPYISATKRMVMKRMMILALIGITVGGYAQDKKNCVCKNKTVQKTAVVKKAVPQAVVTTQPCTHDEWVNVYIWNKVEPCTQYTKNNIVVTQCPGVFYDNSDIERLYEFKSEKAFGGYYPAPRTVRDNITGPVAPQHNVIDNYKGEAPANGNACTNNCTPQ
jgi:hypothetical protein